VEVFEHKIFAGKIEKPKAEDYEEKDLPRG
jgi:hypothetical protein